MLVSQQTSGLSHRRQGSRRASLAELRRRLARPSDIEDGHRQRLLDLARRLSAVQLLGDGYDRIQLSEFVNAAMDRRAAAV